MPIDAALKIAQEKYVFDPIPFEKKASPEHTFARCPIYRDILTHISPPKNARGPKMLGSQKSEQKLNQYFSKQMPPIDAAFQPPTYRKIFMSMATKLVMFQKNGQTYVGYGSRWELFFLSKP